jgi:hypothetical protein
MPDYSLTYFLIRILLGAVGTFCAILFWPRNRDTAWVFMILGTLVLYLHIVFEMLVKIKLLIPEYFILAGVPLFEGVAVFFANAPFLLFAIGFIIMIARK